RRAATARAWRKQPSSSPASASPGREPGHPHLRSVRHARRPPCEATPHSPLTGSHLHRRSCPSRGPGEAALSVASLPTDTALKSHAGGETLTPSSGATTRLAHLAETTVSSYYLPQEKKKPRDPLSPSAPRRCQSTRAAMCLSRGLARGRPGPLASPL